MPKTLYICYFGVREALVQTQVLPYLRELRKDGIDVLLLTFEPDYATTWTAKEIGEVTAQLAQQGIEWVSLPYHKRLSVIATAYDVARGSWYIRGLLRRENIDVLHGRVHAPTLMGLLGRKLAGKRPKLLFDIRGFFPDEYTDAGIWTNGGLLYRSVKRIEAWLIRESDGFVVLTNKARDILFPESAMSGFDKQGRPVEVIPCCVDRARFEGGWSRAGVRNRLGISDRYVLAYVGSFGGWYLTGAMMDLFQAARSFRPNTFVLILALRDEDSIRAKLRRRGYADSDFLVKTVRPSDIAEYLIASDLAVSFIKSCYSKLASSPTKMAEYLACGLPVISNRGVGDVDEVIENNRVGSIVDEMSKDGYVKALEAIQDLGNVSARCRETAIREFDLAEVGGSRYRRLYKRLLA